MEESLRLFDGGQARGVPRVGGGVEVALQPAPNPTLRNYPPSIRDDILADAEVLYAAA
ncbi:hypothetical protein ACFWPK_15410 [Nocardia sp. NPDC058519]|uniref:hypothetical protein n=1 Tax=Nocardia sp. NPDC058519 TaxID=3346535 RepID=UPI00364FC4E9